VPLLFLLERRTRGEFSVESSRAQNPGRYERLATYGDWGVATYVAALAGWSELSLWGPRMMMEAWSTLRQRARLGHVDPRLATDVLWWLRDHDAAVHVNQVPDLPRPQRATVLSFLVLHDWIDASRDGRRIWLRSTTQHLFRRAAA
jgi:hypothetical protein